MRKSAAVPVTLLAALAAMTIGCRDASESRNCVDAQGRIVPDANCSAPASGRAGGYGYIYGGRSGGQIGDRVVGGSSTPSESGVARGGFGHAGGEGGE